MKKKTIINNIAIILSLSVITGSMPLSQITSASAEGKTALSASKMTLAVGGEKTLKLKNNKKKTTWRITAGKKYIRLKNKAKNSVKIAGIKAGTAKVQVKAGKAKYACKVIVKAKGNSDVRQQATHAPQLIVPVSDAPVVPVNPSVTQQPNLVVTQAPQSSKPMESSNPETEDEHLGIQTNILENIDNAEYDNDGYIKLTGIRVGNDQIAEKDITIDTDDNHVWILCGNLAIDQIGGISLYFQQSNVKYSVQYIEESFLSGQVNADVGYYKITVLYEMEDKTVWYKDYYVLKETEKDSGDVEKLKELIKVQKETGKNRISSDINSSQYIWKNGRLDTILWDSLGIQGEMVLEGFDSLTHFGCNDNKIKYLQIRNCPQLECIRCNQNQLTDLDVTEVQSLCRLKCSNNRLKTLNIDSNLKLEYVDASGNELMNLNVQNNNHLQCLFVSFNRLAMLDIQNNEELMELECSSNQLTDIDVSQNLKLTNLGCGGNQLSQLDVKGLVQLKNLNCYDNQLKDLNISQNINLEHLHCSRNQISTLYVGNNQQLTDLYCESNGIQELNVAGNYKLRVLYCGNNKIKELNIQNNSELWCLACDNNPISTIDITNNHKLELFSYGDGDVPVTVIGQNGREFTSAYFGWDTGSPDEDW